jgi:hypothetical protein
MQLKKLAHVSGGTLLEIREDNKKLKGLEDKRALFLRLKR